MNILYQIGLRLLGRYYGSVGPPGIKLPQGCLHQTSDANLA